MWARCAERLVTLSRVHLVLRSHSSTPSSEAASPEHFCSTTTSRVASPSVCVCWKPLGLRRCCPDHSTTIIRGLPPQHHQHTTPRQVRRSHRDHNGRHHHRRHHHDHHGRHHRRQSMGQTIHLPALPPSCPRQCGHRRHRCRDEPRPRWHRGKHPLLGVAHHRSLPKLLKVLAVLGVLV